MKKKKLMVILVLLLVLTSFFTIITYAKYMSMSHGNGSKAIAKWEVDTNNQNDKNVNIVAGEGC